MGQVAGAAAPVATALQAACPLRTTLKAPRERLRLGPLRSARIEEEDLAVKDEHCTPEERGIVERDLILPARGEETGFERGSVFFVGTATVIIRYAGFTILTDPNFLHAGDHVHLGYGLVSRRQTNPAVEIEDLPRLDFVLLSHLHGDHFDRVVERKLNKATPIISTSHATRYLQKVGFTHTHSLETWGSIDVKKGEASL